jgi:hypothetical protein
VVGLYTWELSRPGLEGDPILRARDAVQAVEMAWESAQRRSLSGVHTQPGEG